MNELEKVVAMALLDSIAGLGLLLGSIAGLGLRV